MTKRGCASLKGRVGRRSRRAYPGRSAPVHPSDPDWKKKLVGACVRRRCDSGHSERETQQTPGQLTMEKDFLSKALRDR